MIRTALLLLFLSGSVSAQFKNSLWVFGDSAGINFTNVSSPTTFGSSIDSRGTCVNITDSNNNLLFYGGTIAGGAGNTGRLWDRYDDQMANGDSIVGGGWYHEMIILPFPGSIDSFYVFSVGVTGSFHYGLYYSIVDMSQNGGLGAVVVKNVQLNTFQAMDALSAVKHGNGRDWWLLFKPAGASYPADNNFYLYLVTPSGIDPPLIQSIGEIIYTNGGNIVISKTGNKILITNWNNLIEIFDFDRCTGALSNPNVVEPENVGQGGVHFGSAFSSSEQIIYVSHEPYFVSDTIFYVYQYDLNASDIAASRDTVFIDYYPNMTAHMRLAPDDKIYVSTWYNCDGWCFPYPDSVYNSVNMNLSVINSPDSLGATCNYSPYSFYLGGKRSYAGLPNNPNYQMEALGGSLCDSLGLPNSIGNSQLQGGSEINVFPNPCYNKTVVTFNAINKNEKVTLMLFNSIGELLLQRETTATVQEVDVSGLAKGVYLLNVQTKKMKWEKRIVKL